MTDEQLVAIRARLEAATPGPWYFDSGGGRYSDGPYHGAVWFNGGHGRTAIFEQKARTIPSL
jgi:hypothetical protein